MKKVIKSLFIVFVLLPSLGYAQETASGFRFLKIGVGARACGMGEAFTAVANDASATYWNPAGLTINKGFSAILQHSEWLLDTRYEYGTVAFPLPVIGAFGIAIHYLTTGEIQGRDELGNSTTTYSSNDLVLSFSFARKFFSYISLGLSGKFLQEGIENESGQGFGFDIGILLDLPSGTRIGGGVFNLGPSVKFITEETPLPTMIRGGISQVLELPNLRIQPAVDITRIKDEEVKYNTGVEFTFLEMMCLRGGYRFNTDISGLTAGAGFKINLKTIDILIDYAFVDGRDLGTTHRVALGLRM